MSSIATRAYCCLILFISTACETRIVQTGTKYCLILMQHTLRLDEQYVLCRRGKQHIIQAVDWTQLSLELWASIFFELRPQNLPLRNLAYGKSWFHELQLQLGTKVFRQHPQLCRILRPRSSSPASSDQLAALTHWCQQHSQHVECVVVLSGSPVLDTALNALQSGHAAVTRVMLLHCPQTAIPMLASFMNLGECVLGHTYREPRSLRALQGLLRLSTLTLSGGRFSDLDAARHLTSLQLRRVTATCAHDCTCVSTLVKLSLKETTLMGFHLSGLAACGRLQVL